MIIKLNEVRNSYAREMTSSHDEQGNKLFQELKDYFAEKYPGMSKTTKYTLSKNIKTSGSHKNYPAANATIYPFGLRSDDAWVSIYSFTDDRHDKCMVVTGTIPRKDREYISSIIKEKYPDFIVK